MAKILIVEDDPLMIPVLVLTNLAGEEDAKRDWGYAGDCVSMMWVQLQQEKADDFVIGTGEAHSIKELCQVAFEFVGKNWKKYVIVDKRFIRPTETGPLVADASKARKVLDWKPKVAFRELVEMLVEANIARLK